MITSPLTSQNWKEKTKKNKKTKKKPFHEAIFSHLKIPEPSFSLTFSIFQYSTMNLKTSNVKTKVKLNFMSVTPCFLGKFLPIFEVFEKFLPHLNSERKEKKRVGHHFADT
jgi:hypothetical protein